jgi:hypothetical protein
MGEVNRSVGFQTPRVNPRIKIVRKGKGMPIHRRGWLRDLHFLWTGVVLMTLLLVTLPVIRARAVDCTELGHGITGTESTGSYWGTRVKGPGADVSTPDVTCPIVRSVYVFQTINNYAEAGWFIDPTGDLVKCDLETTPHVLVFMNTNGFSKCKQSTSGLSSTFHGFTVENPSHDHDFTYSVDGNDQGSFTADFIRGNAYSASERHHSGDSLRAEFDGLQYLGTAGDWNNWGNFSGNDSIAGWDLCEISATHYKVRQSC